MKKNFLKNISLMFCNQEKKIERQENQFEKAIRNGDIDVIIKFIESGTDVNTLFERTETGLVDGEFSYEYTLAYRPLDMAESPAVERLLRAFGAKTQQEIIEEELAKKREEHSSKFLSLKKAREEEEEERKKKVDAYLGSLLS